MQVIADFMAAVCLLQVDAAVYGNFLQKIRKSIPAQLSTDDNREDAGNATVDVIFNLAVIAGYMAYMLDFKRYQATQR